MKKNIKYLFKWLIALCLLSLSVGAFVALFLWLLDKVTQLHYQNQWLLFLLPLSGILINGIYSYFGKNAEGGNKLILQEINRPSCGGVSIIMMPLILVTTLITHFFGGSAGREGTAVQMGGSIASFFSKLFNFSESDLKIILMCGVAAGFGSVFGTPLTGAVFAFEILIIKKINYKAFLPCFAASILANKTCTAFGIHHTIYKIITNNYLPIYFNVILLIKIIFAAIIFGLISLMFIRLSQTIKNLSNKFINPKYIIPFLGGIFIIALRFALNTTDFLGLGVTSSNSNAITILSCFRAGGANYFSWFWKLIFTVITLSMGFKGGEVTPLFFIGAALGNTLAIVMGMPVDLLAGLGFVAVFASATNTPIASTIMAIELFGIEYIVYYAVVCFVAYYFSGQSSIYKTPVFVNNKIENL